MEGRNQVPCVFVLLPPSEWSGVRFRSSHEQPALYQCQWFKRLHRFSLFHLTQMRRHFSNIHHLRLASHCNSLQSLFLQSHFVYNECLGASKGLRLILLQAVHNVLCFDVIFTVTTSVMQMSRMQTPPPPQPPPFHLLIAMCKRIIDGKSGMAAVHLYSDSLPQRGGSGGVIALADSSIP